ncbi:hypothetical protein BS47DRAFT_126787 [Hydnum rufescens UP504]|uniref:Uncharacterized protein n=1 Tax=Hydnum rufescens UP504 TaxID=1448309 RepID=A0A9P6APY4_9AGAM|nr:hypothetical protein BS47DRAFT_126787 [Hydnum rufescens UP504]
MLSALAMSMSVAQARMDAWRKKRVSLSPIEELPHELLAEIAWNIPLRHAEGGYVVAATDLASFSVVSPIMRAVTLPILFSRVPISSQRLMLAFTNVPTYLLRFVREVSIFMDVEFMDAWAEWAFAGMEDRGSKPSPYSCLAHILVHCAGLETLRIRVAELSGARSAWGKFALSHGFAIPIGRALADALSLWPRASLSRLKTLELDGFQCIGPLLRMSPNLESLRLCLSGGFPPFTNAELVRSLKFVPKLRHLEYTPESLRVHVLSSEIFPPIGDDDDDIPVGGGSNSELIKALGTALPELETLDLQTRFFGDDIYFCSSLESLDAGDLIEAMEHFNCLKRLALPSSVYASTDFFALRGLTARLDDRRHTLEDRLCCRKTGRRTDSE